jgi:hypothetical protein
MLPGFDERRRPVAWPNVYRGFPRVPGFPGGSTRRVKLHWQPTRHDRFAKGFVKRIGTAAAAPAESSGRAAGATCRFPVGQTETQAQALFRTQSLTLTPSTE